MNNPFGLFDLPLGKQNEGLISATSVMEGVLLHITSIAGPVADELLIKYKWVLYPNTLGLLQAFCSKLQYVKVNENHTCLWHLLRKLGKSKNCSMFVMYNKTDRVWQVFKKDCLEAMNTVLDILMVTQSELK